MTCRYSYSLLLVCLLSTSLLTACGRKTASEQPPPPAATQPPTSTAQASQASAEDPAQEARFSGGLGLSKEAFALKHGRIVPQGGGSRYFSVDGIKEASIYEIGEQDNVKDMSISPPPQPDFKPRTLEELRALAAPYLPADRQFIKLYLLDDPAPQGKIFISDGPIDLYSSEWLKPRFSESEWREKGPPGYFYVRYFQDTIWISIGQSYPQNPSTSQY